jgi:amino acid adenylation domain-containing protein
MSASLTPSQTKSELMFDQPSSVCGQAPESIRGTLVPHLVARRAAIAPNDLAITAAGESLTYGALNTRATEISALLQSWGAGPGTLVGLCLERSTAFVTGALGILQSGAAYVPMDPKYPVKRLVSILRDAQPVAVLTDLHSSLALPAGVWRMLRVDIDLPQTTEHSGTGFTSKVTGENVAYVIYTSGSTGHPKGVQITHNNLLNLIAWHQQEFNVDPSDRASQIASLGFDAAVWELWPYLTAGASVHMADDAIRRQPEALRDWLISQRISIAFVPTPLAERMVTLDWPSQLPLRILLTGGDTLHVYPPANLPFTFVNNYGPTECTVVATSCRLPAKEHNNPLPPIGRAISNTQILILDQQLRLVPAGTTGEIYIGGAGTGCGYLNSPELTAARFIANPLKPDRSLLYRTGDLGRYLPDGQIAFQGRIDEQIKIRGYRIEPIEIVTCLNDYPGVEASVVIASDNSTGDKYLIAYIVPAFGWTLAASSLRQFLQARLPEYMIPRTFVKLQSLPTTLHGKVDTCGLPPPDHGNTIADADVLEPRTVVEERIVKILSGLLNIDVVGVHDNFFLLGGHSLLAAQLIAAIRDSFGVELALRTIFDSPTAAKLSIEVANSVCARIDAMTVDEVKRSLGDTHPLPSDRI